MVVKFKGPIKISRLDIACLGFFLGLRVNELVRLRMERAGFKRVQDSYGYLIQHLIQSDRTITELAERMEITHQAVSKTVAELIALGMVQATPGTDHGSKRICLSRRGRACVKFGRRTRKEFEERLTMAVGHRNYNQAKTSLIGCLDILGGVEMIQTRVVQRPGCGSIS